jgi:hypothetical protein
LILAGLQGLSPHSLSKLEEKFRDEELPSLQELAHELGIETRVGYCSLLSASGIRRQFSSDFQASRHAMGGQDAAARLDALRSKFSGRARQAMGSSAAVARLPPQQQHSIRQEVAASVNLLVDSVQKLRVAESLLAESTISVA